MSKATPPRCSGNEASRQIVAYVEFVPGDEAAEDGLEPRPAIRLRVPSVGVDILLLDCRTGLVCRLASRGDEAAQYEFGTDFGSVTARVFRRGDELLVREWRRAHPMSNDPAFAMFDYATIPLPCGATVHVVVRAPKRYRQLYSESKGPAYREFGWPSKVP